MASDSFTYSNGALATVSSGVWAAVSGTTDCTVASNHVVANAGLCVSRYATAFAGDQYSEIAFTTLPDGFVGAVLHCSSSTNSFYFFYVNAPGTVEIHRVTGGSFSLLDGATITPITSGTLRAEATGSALRLLINGVEICSATDSTFAANNYVGVTAGNGGGGNPTFDNWTGGALGAAATDLVVANAAHAHTADNVTLAAPGVTTLTVANAGHTHSATDITLTQAHVLTVAAALHAHSATSPSEGGLQAVRFDGIADRYSRSTAGLSGDFTFSLWFYRTAVTGLYETLIGALTLPTFAPWWWVNLGHPDDPPHRLRFDTTGGIVDSGLNPAVGTWYFVAATKSGTTGRIYYAADGAASLTTVFGSVSAITDTMTLGIGGTEAGSENLNGRIAAVKIWAAALTQAELDTERPYYTPQRTTGLWAAYPFDTGPSTADASGNSRTLTASGTLTAEAGPPILMSPQAGLTVDNAFHAHTGVHIALSPNIVLAVASASHGHTAAGPTLAGITVTLTVAAATHAHTARHISFVPLLYPVTVAARKWFDQNGNVFVLRTMASWALGQNATNAEITTALEGLAARNFNGVTFAPMGVNNPSSPSGNYQPFQNAAGQAFFTGTPLQSGLGPGWSSTDHIMSEATRLGMTALIVIFVSWGGEGLAPHLIAAGTTNCYNFGFALATRYAGYPNIVWHLMADDDWNYGSSISLAVDAVFHGIRDAEGATHRLITAEPVYTRSAYSQFISQEGVGGAGYEWFRVDLNTAIRVPVDEAVNVSDAAWNEVGATSEAHWIDEPAYVHSPYYGGNHNQQVRERNYATFLRGGVGINFGNEYWWPTGSEGLFGGTRSDWLLELNDLSTMQAQYAWNVLAAYCADATFLPNSAFVSTGLGVGDTKAAAGLSSNVALAYFPTNRSVVVDTTMLAGTGNVRLRWYDPYTGAFTTIVDSEAQNPLRAVAYPAAHSDASNDWLLVVENVTVTIGAVANALHGHTATDVAAGTQVHVLTVASAAHASSSANVVLSLDAVVLNVAHSLHDHTATTITLAQTNELTVADTLHSHTAASVTLVETTLLALQSAIHSHNADNIDILIGGTNLAIDAAIHGHSAENIALSQVHTTVAVFAGIHAHTATNVNLVNPSTFIVIGDARRTLTVLDAERTAEATDAPD